MSELQAPEGAPSPSSGESAGAFFAEGPAFPLGVKLLATALVAGTLYWGARSSGALLLADWTSASAVVTGTALVLVVWCLYWMWRSRTRADAQGVHQSWIWTKQVRWADMTQAKLIAVPGLEWLVAPRLVVRPRGGGIVVFHSADRAVLAAFAHFAATGLPPQA